MSSNPLLHWLRLGKNKSLFSGVGGGNEEEGRLRGAKVRSHMLVMTDDHDHPTVDEFKHELMSPK